MFKKKAAKFNPEERGKNPPSIILVKVLIYAICAFTVTTSGLTRISEANSLVGSTAYTVNTSYGQVISGGTAENGFAQQPEQTTPSDDGQPSIVTDISEPAQVQYPSMATGVETEDPGDTTLGGLESSSVATDSIDENSEVPGPIVEGTDDNENAGNKP